MRGPCIGPASAPHGGLCVVSADLCRLLGQDGLERLDGESGVAGAHHVQGHASRQQVGHGGVHVRDRLAMRDAQDAIPWCRRIIRFGQTSSDAAPGRERFGAPGLGDEPGRGGPPGQGAQRRFLGRGGGNAREQSGERLAFLPTRDGVAGQVASTDVGEGCIDDAVTVRLAPRIGPRGAADDEVVQGVAGGVQVFAPGVHGASCDVAIQRESGEAGQVLRSGAAGKQRGDGGPRTVGFHLRPRGRPAVAGDDVEVSPAVRFEHRHGDVGHARRGFWCRGRRSAPLQGGGRSQGPCLRPGQPRQVCADALERPRDGLGPCGAVHATQGRIGAARLPDVQEVMATARRRGAFADDELALAAGDEAHVQARCHARWQGCQQGLHATDGVFVQRGRNRCTAHVEQGVKIRCEIVPRERTVPGRGPRRHVAALLELRRIGDQVGGQAGVVGAPVVAAAHEVGAFAIRASGAPSFVGAVVDDAQGPILAIEAHGGLHETRVHMGGQPPRHQASARHRVVTGDEAHRGFREPGAAGQELVLGAFQDDAVGVHELARVQDLPRHARPNRKAPRGSPSARYRNDSRTP